MDKELKKIIKENYSNIIDDGVKENDHVEELYSKTVDQIKGSLKKTKRKGLLKRLSIIAACLIILFLGSVYLADIPAVQAFRFDVRNAFDSVFNNGQNISDEGTIIRYYTSLEEVEPEMAEKLPVFGWIPDGFQLDFLETQEAYDGTFIANYSFIDEADGIIGISLITYTKEGTSSYNYGAEYDLMDINNMQVAISEDEPYNATFFYRDTYMVTVNTTIDKDDLIKMIANIE